MKRPKPGYKNFIKTRIRHPFIVREDRIFEGANGQKFRDAGGPHTVLINLTTGLFIGITVLFLNCTVWYILLCAVVVLLLYLLRYFWTDFKPADEQGNLTEGDIPYTRKKKTIIFIVVILILAAAAGACFLFIGSPYSRPIRQGVKEVGEGYVVPQYQDIDSMVQAYECARALAIKNASNAFIIHYGMQISNEGVYYCFLFRNQAPGFFIKRTHEFEIMSAYIKQSDYGLLHFCYYLYDSPSSSFNAVSPPETEINAEKIINILKEKAGIDREETEYFYIATGFLTDLPELSEPGGDIWAVHIKSSDRILYYTVDVSKETARLEKVDKADETL